MQQKVDKLRKILQQLGSVAVAFSGGVDSSLLLAYAAATLGQGNCLAVCADSEVFTQRELQQAKQFCQERGITLSVLEHKVLDIAGFDMNPPDRCYLCKRSLMAKLVALKGAQGLAYAIEGSNADDLQEHRPGRQAVLEYEVRSPLAEAGLSKAEVRMLARRLRLPNADSAAQSCLATRFATGEQLSQERLRLVEQAEDYLHAKGFHLVRVRVSGMSARIECDPAGLELLQTTSLRSEVGTALLALGFEGVSVDQAGYRLGSMDSRQGK